MTITTEPSTTAVDMECWRDDMIDLALAMYTVGNTDDTATLVIISNALNDIRVRDALVWYMTTIDDEGLDMVIQFAIADAKANGDTAPMAAMAATAAMFMDDIGAAMAWTAKALLCDQNYSYANLLGLTIGFGIPTGEYKKMINDLGYDAARNAQD
jgi:hypothetical protein